MYFHDTDGLYCVNLYSREDNTITIEFKDMYGRTQRSTTISQQVAESLKDHLTLLLAAAD